MYILLWTDTLAEPRAQTLRPAVFKFWINLLLLARVTDRAGALPQIAQIAYALRCADDACAHAIAQLEEAALVVRDPDGTLRIHNYSARQNPDFALREPRIAAQDSRSAARNIYNVNTSPSSTETPEKGTKKDATKPIHTPRDPQIAQLAAQHDARFAQWYAYYPRKADRKRAEEAWRKLAPDEALARRLVAALRRQVAAGHWSEGYWPYPATWLNGERWSDNPHAGAGEGSNGEPRHGAGPHAGAVAPPEDSWDRPAGAAPDPAAVPAL